MITRENINEIISMISIKDKKRIKKTRKEYIVLLLHCTNNTSYVQVILTNDFSRYQYVSKNGNCILSVDEGIFNNL